MAFYYTEIESKLSAKESQEKLKTIIKKDPGVFEKIAMQFKREFDYEAEFYGRVWEDGFLMKRNIIYKNSFLPIIYGKSTPAINGSKIRIFMVMHPFGLIISTIMLVVLGKHVVEIMLKNSYANDFPLLLGFLFVLIVSMGGFLFEVIAAKKVITKKLNI